MSEFPFPLQEFDTSPGLISPAVPLLTEPLPTRVVLCFFPELVAALPTSHGARRIGAFSVESGGGGIFVIGSGPDAIAVTHPGMGAPLATHHLEQLITAGGTAFVACGGAGAVLPDLALGHVVVPTSAVRDEGTSYHYAPASRTIAADRACADTAMRVLNRLAIPHLTGPVWTTDASYRETPARIRRRRNEGCLVVEMEAAALIAAAGFRSVRLAYYLYAGDDVSGDQWDHRHWSTSDRREVLLNASLTTVAEISLL